jgi:hypothetical protein
MKRQIRFVWVFAFLFLSVLTIVPPVSAYERPTAGEVREVQDKINEGNRVREDFIRKVQEMAAAREAGDTERTRRLVSEALELLNRFKRLRQEAIELADRYYNPDNSNVNGEPQYDIGVRGEGVAYPDGTVRIGERAFTTAGLLATTKLHEFTHADQAAENRWPITGKGVNIAECEAYDRELENAEASGLTGEQIAEIERRRNDNHYNALSESNQREVDRGNYNTHVMVPLRDAIRYGFASVVFMGTGRAAGTIFKLQVTRTTPDPFTLEIDLGTPLSPGVDGVQNMMVGEEVNVRLKEKVTVIDVPGYCLDPELIPPPTDQQIEEQGLPRPGWQVENPWEYPGRCQAPAGIIRAGNELSGTGKFHTDMPKTKYRETVIQRALWYNAKPGTFNKERLKSDLEEQVKAGGGKQTPEQIEKLTDNLWEDIDLTLKKAKPGTKR